MGFLQGLTRLAKGEPIFQPQNQLPHSGAHSSAQQAPGSKVIPKVEVEEAESHVSGQHLKIVARISNHSGGRIELDKIRLLNTTRELDTWLNPHEEKEFTIYDGSVLSQRHYDDAWLDYKDATGDYFQQYHTVTFQQEAGNMYSVQYIRPSGSIKDI